MGFTARHPRYTIALIVLLFVSVLIFANSDPSPDYLSRPYPITFRKGGLPPPPGYVEDQIKTSEAYYQESLKERQKLITKWGPSPSQVDAFPSNGEFYTLCKQMRPVCLFLDQLRIQCVGDFFTPAFQCPHQLQRIGTLGDGGKWVCGMERIEDKQGCVIYSVGASISVSELSIIRR
jgi:hypothetical protein